MLADCRPMGIANEVAGLHRKSKGAPQGAFEFVVVEHGTEPASAH